jgi:hypothetical protein
MIKKTQSDRRFTTPTQAKAIASITTNHNTIAPHPPQEKRSPTSANLIALVRKNAQHNRILLQLNRSTLQKRISGQ